MNRYKNIKWFREKRFRALSRERHQLLLASFSLGYLPLEKPLKHGWFKHLALRDDIARRKDASVFLEILKVSGMDIWGRDKKHADKVWNETSKQDKEVQFPGIRKLNQRAFDKLSPKAQKWYEGFDWYWCPFRGHIKRYYCRVPRYYFKLAYTRGYITKRKIVDPQLERRMAEVEAELQSNEYFDSYTNYYRSSWRSFQHHKRVRRRVKQSLSAYDEEHFDRETYVRPGYG